MMVIKVVVGLFHQKLQKETVDEFLTFDVFECQVQPRPDVTYLL